MAHPFLEARSKIVEMKKAANLLDGVDRYAQPDFLLAMAENELHELDQELGAYGSSEFSQEKLEGEFDDVYVFYMSWLLTHAPQIDMMTTIHSANGYGSHSAALEKLGPVIRDSADDPTKAVAEFVNRFFSVGLHLPTPYVSFSSLDKTIRKVLSNRHPTLYNTYCPILKRELRDEELMLKYLHLEKGTRLVRSVVGRTLQTSDWRPHFVQLVDWTNSSDQLDLLSARLFGHSDVRQAGKIENAKMEMTN